MTAHFPMTNTELVKAFEQSDMGIQELSNETGIPTERVILTLNGEFEPMSVDMEQYEEVLDIESASA